MDKKDSLLLLAPPLVVALWFLLLTRRGLATGFSYDDVNNLYHAWVEPLPNLLKGALLVWAGTLRGAGQLFYRGMFSVAGFHPEPFRAACYLLLLLNLVLAYILFLRVSRAWHIASLALLIACFHGTFWDVYSNTGAIYDILCQTFYLTTLLLFIWWPRRLVWIWIPLTASLALNSKEMAVTLPIVLAAYEGLLRPAAERSRQHWAMIGVVTLLTGALVLARFTIHTNASGNSAYTPSFTLSRYIETTTTYIGYLCFEWAHLGSVVVFLLLAGWLAAALVSRSRVVLFGWLYFVAGMLPMQFVPARSNGYSMYIPYTGLALSMAVAIAAASRRVPRLEYAAALLIACLQWKQQEILREKNAGPGGQPQIRELSGSLLGAAVPTGGKVLLVDDDLGDRYIRLMAVRLILRDPALQVAAADRSSFASARGEYDRAFLFQDGRYEAVTNGDSAPEPAPFVQMGWKKADWNVIHDIESPGPGGDGRWAHADPELQFLVPPDSSRFRVRFVLPEVTLKQTGPVHVDFFFADRLVASKTFGTAGEANDTTPVPSDLPRGQVIRVKLHVRNPYVDPKDGTRLGMLLLSAGFEK